MFRNGGWYRRFPSRDLVALCRRTRREGWCRLRGRVGAGCRSRLWCRRCSRATICCLCSGVLGVVSRWGRGRGGAGAGGVTGGPEVAGATGGCVGPDCGGRGGFEAREGGGAGDLDVGPSGRGEVVVPACVDYMWVAPVGVFERVGECCCVCGGEEEEGER